ncbi:hypothetical protein HBB16_13090 [Pseudonocardia sp. MCCB 268]|nr:hypothetical protein [Pseudonocardia cytotoxica]
MLLARRRACSAAWSPAGPDRHRDVADPHITRLASALGSPRSSGPHTVRCSPPGVPPPHHHPHVPDGTGPGCSRPRWRGRRRRRGLMFGLVVAVLGRCWAARCSVASSCRAGVS